MVFLIYGHGLYFSAPAVFESNGLFRICDIIGITGKGLGILESCSLTIFQQCDWKSFREGFPSPVSSHTSESKVLLLAISVCEHHPFPLSLLKVEELPRMAAPFLLCTLDRC